MVNEAIGYRAPSVTDLWSGNSRWSEGTQKAVRDFATLALGKDAYWYLAKGEGLTQDVVSYAKTTIIVRSLVVALDNIMGNGLHLMLHGIDPVTGFKAMRDR